MKVNKNATFLVSTLGGGGAEGVCVNVANGLAEDGWDIDLVVLNLNNAVYLKRVSDKVNLVVLEVNNARYSFWKLRNYLLTNKPSKVLVFNYELAIILVLVRIFFKLEFMLIARNINTISQVKKNAKGSWRKQALMQMLTKLYSKSDLIINQCKKMESDLLMELPDLNGKTCVIYNPVNKLVEDTISNLELGSVAKENYLLCVGRLVPQKGFNFAIEAFSKLTKSHSHLRLKIVGGGGLEAELKEYAKALGIADKVDFEGFREDIIPYFLNARATLLPSLYEGFPNVLVESITLGTPVIAFDCQSGPSEIVQNKNGLLTPYMNVEKFISDIEQVLSLEWNPLNVSNSLLNLRTNKIIAEYEKILL